MVAAITSDALLARIKARAQIPAAESRLSDAEIFAIVDDLTITSLGRSVFDADDGRWIKTAADVSIASGTHSYRLPDRAWAGGVDEVLLVNSAGEATQIPYVDRADVWQYTGAAWGPRPSWTLLGDVVRLLPTPTDSTYSLRVRYMRRPSRLVAVSSCAQIATGGVASGALTVDSVPSSWTGATLTVDVVESTNNVESLEDDVSVTESSLVLTRGAGSFASTGAYAITADDYVCQAGETCVVQVPDVAIGHLSMLASMHVCIALGDREGAANLAQASERSRSDMEQAMARRSRMGARAVPWGSPLRSTTSGRRRWGWWR